ncbi:PfkB family carbohydrate kinase [Acuticoccus mangrovi]|uniref:Carbohydrate kinase PfkB domain-containing protein n=1 Tax=Acuticoccus mangrovi TaxID=2796142 RepID=A0A934IJL8_9HYPH|nr:hypothetical protein [Acuticoccus mangrovi]
MIVTCGEAMVDLMPETVGGETLFRPIVGGSLYNVALGVARLGGRAGYLWELSHDTLGVQLLAGLRGEGVDVAAVRVAARATPVAVVDLSGPEPRFNIADPDAVMVDTVPPGLPDGAECLVIGSAVLAREPVAAAIEALAATAPRVAIDYNVRQPSIVDLAAYKARLVRLSGPGAIVKASVADLAFLGEQAPHAFMKGLLEAGAALVVLTAGADGAWAWTAAGEGFVPSMAGPIVDAVGAGDAFMAGLMAHLQGIGALKDGRAAELGSQDIALMLDFAQRVAAATCGCKGAVMPHLSALRGSAAPRHATSSAVG